MTRLLAVIPARMGSSRFPGKPLALLHGRPLIEHVYRGTAACTALDDVLIATCDEEIATVARSFGAAVRMTSDSHERASDRVAEAIRGDPADVIVMVQGDEPMTTPTMIEAALKPFSDDCSVACVNLAAPIRSPDDLRSQNTVKVVMSSARTALYYSRQPIPTPNFTRPERTVWYKQVCVIPFRRDALETFASLPQGPLERAESVDMLRFLENGVDVHLVVGDFETHAVDTPADLAYVATLISR